MEKHPLQLSIVEKYVEEKIKKGSGWIKSFNSKSTTR